MAKTASDSAPNDAPAATADNADKTATADVNKPGVPDTAPTKPAAPGTDPSIAGDKITVKTTGNHMYHDPYTLEDVLPGEDTSITKTSAVETAILNKQLEEVK